MIAGESDFRDFLKSRLERRITSLCASSANRKITSEESLANHNYNAGFIGGLKECLAEVDESYKSYLNETD